MNFINKLVCGSRIKHKTRTKITKFIAVEEYKNNLVLVKYKHHNYDHKQELFILEKLHDVSAVSKVIETTADRVIMKYFTGGDLYEYYIKQKELLPIRDVCKIMYNLCHIVSDIHDRGVHHLDLKLENICIGESLNSIYVIDFSGSIFMDKNKISGIVSTFPYMSPEYINFWDRAHIGYSVSKEQLKYVDTWSIGVILYALLYGIHPFGSSVNSTIDQVKFRVVNLRYSFPERSDGIQVPKELIDIIKSILVIDGRQRPAIAAIRDVVHKFM